MQDKDLKEIVAQNIFYLRTVNRMTQYELAEQLNYSDKAVSKWERADALPDAYVLKHLSNIFNVSVDYLLTEHTEQDKKVETATNKSKDRYRALILGIAMVSVLTIALLAFVVLANATGKYVWQIFIYVLPVISIIGVVLTSVWKKTIGIFSFLSLLVWSIPATVYFAIGNYGLWLIFMVAIPLQILVFLSFGVKINIKMSRKENPILITAMNKIKRKSNKKGQ